MGEVCCFAWQESSLPWIFRVNSTDVNSSFGMVCHQEQTPCQANSHYRLFVPETERQSSEPVAPVDNKVQNLEEPEDSWHARESE
jgi:hypothetical protein